MRRHVAEDGFTVIEVLIASVILLLCSWSVFGVIRQLANNGARVTTSAQNVAAIDQLAAALTSDASTALAIYNPADDLCTGTTSQGLALAYKDNTGALQTATYQFDGTNTVTRTASGTTNTYSGLTFSARCITAPNLAAADGFNLGFPIADIPVNLGTTAQNAGNRVMIVQIASTQLKAGRELHLFAGTAPTGFTIQGPQWHVVISRRDHTRRFLFGLGQVSWLQIIVEIDISYDNWQSSTPWCTWEDAEIYGASPKFNPDDFPVFTGAPDDDPPAVVQVPYQGGAHTWALTADLYPETLLQYCRRSAPDPPGPPGGASPQPLPAPTADDVSVPIPPWWAWQTCGPTETCPPGTAAPVSGCDPSQDGGQGNCTVTVPPAPPQGWSGWCAQYAPPVWGAPQFGPPCPQSTPPPSPSAASPTPAGT